MKWSTSALREHSLPVLPGLTVQPELLCLTASHRPAQSYELVRHLDILDVGEDVVALPIQLEGHGVYQVTRSTSFNFILDFTYGF